MNDQQKEKARERAKAYYYANLEKCRTASREFQRKRVLTPEQQQANKHRAKAWYIAHRDEQLIKKREYHAKHRAKFNALSRDYRAAHHDELVAKQAAKYWADPETARAKKMADHNKHREQRIEKMRLQYWADPEKHRASNRARQSKDPSGHVQRTAEWRRNNPEKLKELRQRERERGVERYKTDREFRERRKASCRKYHTTHPDAGIRHASIRRARVAGAEVGDTAAVAKFIRWLQDVNHVECFWCLKPIPKGRRTRHADHVIPIARGGKHCVENLVPACSVCNCSKHAKTGTALERWIAERRRAA